MVDTSSSAVPDVTVPAGRYTVIARRYRPQAFAELVGQEQVARALQQAITSDRVGHAYLFTGARGVGKTSAARILAKALNCVQGPTPAPCNECDVCQRVAAGDDVDVLEIDGASNRGIDEIRQLRQNVAIRPSRVRYKIYIIDEVHMLTKEAFNALLKTLEEPPEHVKFIFATTEPQKIPITILSRCQRFDFAGIGTASIQERLAQIAAAEGATVDNDALQILASRAAGSMRDSQSLLEQLLAIGAERITAVDVNDLLGIAPAERLSGLVRHLSNRDASAVLVELDSTLDSGVEVGLLLDQLIGYYRDVMVAAVGCEPERLHYVLPSQAAEVAEIGRQLGIATVLAIGQILDHTAARMRVSMHGRTLVEMALVRICQLGELDDLATLLAELQGTVAADPAAQTAENGQPLTTGANSARAPQAAEASKKNVESPAATSLADGLANAVAMVSAVTRVPLPSAPPGTFADTRAPATAATPAATPIATQIGAPQQASELAGDPNAQLAELGRPGGEEEAPAESVLAMYQRAVAEGGAVRSAAAVPARKSRREQLAEIAEQPLVRRAMELFDVPPGQFRYSPPGGDTSN